MLSTIRIQKKLLGASTLLMVAVSVFALFVASQVSAAGSASFSLSPSSGTLKKNSTVSITVNVTSSDEINAVQADVAYDSSKLDYVGHSFSGSAFDFSLGDPTDSGSVVSVARGKNGVLTGTNKLVTLNFKVLGESGSASLTFRPTSGISASGGNDVWNGSANGGSFSLAPADTSSGSSNTGSVQPPTESGAPTENDIRVNSELDDDQPVTVASVEDKTEYLVAVQVLNKEGNPVEGTEVKLSDKISTTDSQGIANFSGLVAGVYTVEALGIQQEIEIKTGDPTEVQNFVLTEKDDSKLILYVVVIGGTLLLLALLALIAKKLRSGKGGYTGVATNGYSPVVDGKSSGATPEASGSNLGQTVIHPTVPPENSSSVPQENDKI